MEGWGWRRKCLVVGLGADYVVFIGECLLVMVQFVDGGEYLFNELNALLCWPKRWEGEESSVFGAHYYC